MSRDIPALPICLYAGFIIQSKLLKPKILVLNYFLFTWEYQKRLGYFSLLNSWFITSQRNTIFKIY